MKKVLFTIIALTICILSYSQGTLTNVGSTIKWDYGGNHFTWEKAGLELREYNDYLLFVTTENEKVRVQYSWVTTPSTANIHALYITISGWITTVTMHDIDTLTTSVYDTFAVHLDTLQAHNIRILANAGGITFSDTASTIGTKFNEDTLTNSVYDSISAHQNELYLLDTGKVSTSGDVIYKSISLYDSLIIKDATGADSISIFDNGTNAIIDNGNPLKIINTFEDTSPDSVLTIDNDIIKASAVLSLSSATGDIANITTGMNVIHTDTIYQKGVRTVKVKISLTDDETYNLPDASNVTGYAMSGANKAQFIIQSDGTSTIEIGTGSTANTDTDATTICVYDSGTRAVIKNRSGGTLTFIISYDY